MNMYPLSIAFILLCLQNTLTATTDNPTHIIHDLSIDCGSVGTSAAGNGREWIGDARRKFPDLIQIKGSSTTSTGIHKLTSSPDLIPYKTTRISISEFSYIFQLKPGDKLIRLHFNPAPYKGFEKFKDLFSVEAGPFTLLDNFSASLTSVNSFAKEFCISSEENQTLNIIFSPANSSTYAFINGIEIISVPTRLSYFRGRDPGAQVIGKKSLVYIDNSTALELIHRLNVEKGSVSSGGGFDDMLGLWASVSKENAQEINSLTWKISVNVGFRYLVRIYFYELAKKAETGDVIFEILINNMIVDTNIDIVERMDYDGSLLYRDYMVMMKGNKQEGKRDLLISVQSNDDFMDGKEFVKGFEIFKVSNPDNSLASPNPLPRAIDSPSWIIRKSIALLNYRNVIVTVAITIVTLVNVIVHMLREIWEASILEDENKPLARAERFCRLFSLAELQSATKHFSSALVIGQGGFGIVYKGFIDNGREIVAIKRLKSNSKQGKREFWTEIETLSKLRHINLVSLIGYCSEREEMILVYEYVACGTLADHLYKLARDGYDCSPLNWKQRLNICIGAGRGLDYLHTGHRVIHRDVKASNILLDENFVAKVSDFGLAKPEDRSKLESHVSTNVKGTFGYFDPYYFNTHKLTRKSDTYAFGVVLLEVLCGRPAMDRGLGEDECSLTKWARNRINKGEVDQIVESSLIGDISLDSLNVFVEFGEVDIKLPKFDLARISAATNQFSSSNKIGLGGFGSVYKVTLPSLLFFIFLFSCISLDGEASFFIFPLMLYYCSIQAVLPTGQIVAVKKFSSFNDFENEIHLVSNLQHPNIVKPLGYCINEDGMLLYEFMENGSLDAFIFGWCPFRVSLFFIIK
ncbi:hypothetical protein BUALT_Bualt04G0133800 [Buddleja alternifolia]|uniref:Protein kinase domain-containing protein n=1 Tax=Buddleja alternifolia TaxID=168488 RepID=A0AAV6XNL7_9LAMI|nr:hypothetical protein BUALT_Bualt04G0133800 [Buddleja alternifolia]